MDLNTVKELSKLLKADTKENGKITWYYLPIHIYMNIIRFRESWLL